jgi:hypothetical protein
LVLFVDCLPGGLFASAANVEWSKATPAGFLNLKPIATARYLGHAGKDYILV